MKKDSISIALYNPEIPQNTGNISRLAVGLDIELFIVGKPGFSMDDKHVKRAGLDYWEHLKLTAYETLELFFEATSHRRKVYATTKGQAAYYNFKYRSDDIIVFGSEGSGLPLQLLHDNLKNTITIPMLGKVRSLNLSNSAAILSYDALLRTGYFENFDKNINYFTELNK